MTSRQKTIAQNFTICSTEGVQFVIALGGFKIPLGDAFGSFLRRTLRPQRTGQPRVSLCGIFGQPLMATGSSAPTDRGGSTVANARFRIRDKTTDLTLAVARSQNGALAGLEAIPSLCGTNGAKTSPVSNSWLQRECSSDLRCGVTARSPSPSGMLV